MNKFHIRVKFLSAQFGKSITFKERIERYQDIKDLVTKNMQVNYNPIWKQFQHFILNITTNSKHTIKTYGNFSYIITKNASIANGIFQIILEKVPQSGHNIGGDSMYCVVKGGNKFKMCDVIDCFNGTYIIECTMLEKCITVNAYLLFSNYMAFYPSHVTPVNYPVIIKQSFCNKVISHASHLSQNTPCQINPEGQTIWHKANNGTLTLSIDKCNIKDIDYEQLYSCLKKYQSISIVGDSHMRYMFYHFLDRFNITEHNLPRKLTTTCNIHNLSFYYANYIDVYVSQLISVADKLRHKKGRHVIIFSGGSWDLAFRTLDGFLLKLYKLINCLEHIKSYKNIYLIWTAVFPYHSNAFHGGGRTNYKITVLNHLVKHYLTKYDIDFFDITYDAMLSVDYMTVCSGHYLCKQDKSTKVTGIGGATVDALLLYLCQHG
jgi:hypothetical protein